MFVPEGRSNKLATIFQLGGKHQIMEHHEPGGERIQKSTRSLGAPGHCEADHIVLGLTGVWVLETKRWGGTLTPGKDVWVQDGRDGRKTHPSPVAQLRRAQQAAADRLGLRADQIMSALVLVRGALAGDAGVRIERPRTLRDAILRASSIWPLPITPEQAARTLTT